MSEQEYRHIPATGLAGQTGASAGLITCDICEALCCTHDEAATHCPICGATLHLRHKDSLTKYLAYLVAAAILYIPANLLPVMQTNTIFGTQDDTIMSGVMVLL